MEDLGDGVLSPASRAEAVGAWLEARLEDRLEHQLEGRLDHPVPHRGDPEGAERPAPLGDPPLPDRQRAKGAGLEIGPELGEE